jgi:hypothetical protein
MRVTFPHWSPDEEKLSVWFTFSPTFRSYLSVVVDSLSRGILHPSLRRGDPAAVFDVKTGKIGWMTVSPQEKVQVAHYHLLKRDYAEAWRWYAEAERELQPPQPAREVSAQEALGTLLAPDGTAFFQSYCLTKLDRPDEAQKKREQFEKDFLARAAGSKELEGLLQTLLSQGGQPLKLEDVLSRRHLLGSLLRDLYIAEVFLSLDASEDGEAFFRQSLENAATDSARLSSAIVLSQFLLLHKKHADYADLTADRLAPLLARLHAAAPPGSGPADWNDLLVTGLGGLALAPTLRADFLAGLPEEQVRKLIPRWRALEAQVKDDTGWHAIDLFLHAAFGRLGLEQAKQAVARRFTQEHHGSADLLDEKKMAEAMEKMRQETRAVFPWR